ncbi:hypothetical protein EDB92DRAFT_1819948 [Lactarius akahatsu]|uniref:Uncharacterized protein n=1 Tax=Lactarius akahatsu TaxID=416441 RepID=A0AAD4L913_9AGAM|nr:hypothetical protein EDB92DRAFT_1819948 [Lactarius akahatsu]
MNSYTSPNFVHGVDFTTAIPGDGARRLYCTQASWWREACVGNGMEERSSVARQRRLYGDLIYGTSHFERLTDPARDSEYGTNSHLNQSNASVLQSPPVEAWIDGRIAGDRGWQRGDSHPKELKNHEQYLKNGIDPREAALTRSSLRNAVVSFRYLPFAISYRVSMSTYTPDPEHQTSVKEHDGDIEDQRKYVIYPRGVTRNHTGHVKGVEDDPPCARR